MKRSEVMRTIRSVELRATLLRQPGFNRLGHEERKRIADESEKLCAIVRWCLDGKPVTGPEIAPARDYDQTAPDDASEDDLFGGAM
jgi:hypothetical protein